MYTITAVILFLSAPHVIASADALLWHADCTPLQLAAATDNFEKMITELKNGADINEQTQKIKGTPLMSALYSGNKRMVSTLLFFDADPAKGHLDDDGTFYTNAYDTAREKKLAHFLALPKGEHTRQLTGTELLIITETYTQRRGAHASTLDNAFFAHLFEQLNNVRTELGTIMLPELATIVLDYCDDITVTPQAPVQ